MIGFKNDKIMDRMGKILAHRGPNDMNFVSLDKVSLGYRRLAIIDLKGSFQPLYSEEKDITLVFNGEIYNYPELREELRQTHQFRTRGDGETIVHWYEDRQTAGFATLNGMFGFALSDLPRKKVYLVRDHFGIKPLYYAAFDKKLIFASEIKAILEGFKELKMKPTPNDKVINNYLFNRVHDNSEETFFTGIKRLLPGNFLEWDLQNDDFTVQAYWSLKKKGALGRELRSNQELVTDFRKLFFDSVRMRLMSEVPVGTALSGGLDSSAVVCAINQEIKDQVVENPQSLGERQRTFSAVFPGAVNNEESYINEVIRVTGVTNFKVTPKREEMWPDLEKVIYHQDEPMISSGPYAQWKVMELAAKNGMKVLLDGQGADEMLAGYLPYYFVYFRELIKGMKVMEAMGEVIKSRDAVWPLLIEKILNLLKIKKSLRVAELFTASVSAAPVINNDLNRRLDEDIFANSLPALLRYEDRNSMAFSLEARVPFLDYRLVEFVANLPANLKIRSGWNKWIMREGLKDILPEKIRRRRWKVGFTTPEISWLRESKKEILEIFNSETFLKRPYFNSAKIREKFLEFTDGKNDESLVFWRIINLELWLRIFID